MTCVTRRLVELLERETTGLADPEFDVGASTRRKERMMLELLRAAREDVRPARDDLEALSARVEAVKRTTRIALDALQADGSDGTYGASSAPRPERAS